MKKYLFGLLLIGCVGCMDATVAQWSSYGKPGVIILYSGGKEVRRWKSTGKIVTETHSDGYYFMDSETNKLIRVSGDIVIEQ